jgi:hypothetical protein
MSDCLSIREEGLEEVISESRKWRENMLGDFINVRYHDDSWLKEVLELREDECIDVSKAFELSHLDDAFLSDESDLAGVQEIWDDEFQ